MPDRYDVAVAGLGAAGSATLYHLAKRGLRVIGFDTHTPPHPHGSSYGESRMIREAYYEDPGYVPLLRRAYTLWHDLAAEAHRELIVETGGVFAGPPDGELIRGAIESARAHGIPIDVMNRHERASLFPWLSIPGSMAALTEPRAGFLRPEACIEAHLRGAEAYGAVVRNEEGISNWDASGSGVKIETPAGTVHAQSIVVCMGAWMTSLLSLFDIRATVTRQTLHWFDAAPDRPHYPDRVYAIEIARGRLLYGFPDIGTGLKAAIHYGGVPTDPNSVDRTLGEEDTRPLEFALSSYLPGVMGRHARGSVCMYTNTPDLHFVIDRHPHHDNVTIVSACSGHGFKLTSAIGEAVAQWMVDGKPEIDLSLFSIDRFSV